MGENPIDGVVNAEWRKFKRLKREKGAHYQRLWLSDLLSYKSFLDSHTITSGTRR